MTFVAGARDAWYMTMTPIHRPIRSMIAVIIFYVIRRLGGNAGVLAVKIRVNKFIFGSQSTRKPICGYRYNNFGSMTFSRRYWYDYDPLDWHDVSEKPEGRSIDHKINQQFKKPRTSHHE